MRVDQVDTQKRRKLPYDYANLSPETKALLYSLQVQQDELYDLAVIRDAEAFATVRGLSQLSLTSIGNGGQKIWTNSSGAAQCIFARLTAPGGGQQAYLFLATDPAKTTTNLAIAQAYGEAPKVTVLLRPGDSLYGDASTPAATASILYAVFQLSGKNAALGGA